KIGGRFRSAKSAAVEVPIFALDQGVRKTAVRTAGESVKDREDARRSEPEKYSRVMHARGMIEKSAARIAGRGPVKVSVRGLNKSSGVGAFAVLEVVNRRENSGGRDLENHAVEIADRPRRRRPIKVAIRSRDQ